MHTNKNKNLFSIKSI